MSKSNYSNENFILKNVKAVDQDKFETNILIKVDKAYKKHVDEERSTIQKELSETCNRIKILSKSVKELNDCLVYNLKTNNCSFEEFNKIKNSLQNQLDLKNQELNKLNKIEKRCRDQLKSLEVSDKFSNILDGPSADSRKRSANVRQSESFGEMPETSDSNKFVDNYDSDSSVESTNTMIFEPSEEQLECVEPIIKKRKIIFASDKSKLKCQRIKYDKTTDDANNDEFQARIGEYKSEVANNSPVDENVELGDGVSISSEIWAKLFGYQQIGVRWLLKLHTNGVGGILGDEMGLGKTIQVIAFLAALKGSSETLPNQCGPVLIVCPATVMRQWVDEFRAWAPLFRVALLHATGSGYDKPDKLLNSIASEPGVLVTTYSSMVIHHTMLTRHAWQYVILDEGHKIKNPNTKVTLCAKQFETPHRIILSGSPIQNNLKELWSLVDFVYPGKLGSMATFIQNFAMPIMKGGYEHASPVQVETAYRCACVIRDTINEYLLRRTKAEVELQLPRKTEQVLFCGLTDHQNVVYKEYLASRQCKLILSGQQLPFPGLVMMRKICNHPDIVTGGPKCVIDHPVLGFSREVGEDGHGQKFGHYSRSGKMVVVRELLQLWYRGRHKVLLFTQARTMLEILKRFLEQQQYPFCSMDGSTSIGARHAIVNRFNETPYDEVFVFLLTTRVGGLGLNLVGANRVLVFDPDWNPCTDLQARERAWRIGQNRKVVIYRLVISGSVEEKIYHRQVFKQFLTNRILKNPRQRRFFKTQDLHDLFRLDESGSTSETAIMFRGTKHHKKISSNYFDEARLPVDVFNVEDDNDEPPPDLSQLDMEADKATDDLVAASSLSDDELIRLRRQARKLSKALSKLQQEGVKRTKVEGKMIVNVQASKELHAQDDTSARIANNTDHIVTTILPNRVPRTTDISYTDVCAAERVATKAKKSLEETLAGAGVTDCIHHDSIIDDITPDWALVKRETDSAARNGVAWLRSYLIPMKGGRVNQAFGTIKNSFLWSKDEESVYFQNLELPSKSHFCGYAYQSPVTMSKPIRFSTPLILTIIRNRSTKDKGSQDSSIVSHQVKSLTKNIFLFLTSPTCQGQTTSNDLITHFRDQVSLKNNLLFKTIINELCTFQRTKDCKEGIWILKAEFINK